MAGTCVSEMKRDGPCWLVAFMLDAFKVYIY